MRKIIFLFILALVIAALFFKNLLPNEVKASVSGGEARISLLPGSAVYTLGQIFPVAIWFNSGGVPISGIALRLSYPYSGAAPEATASEIQINSSLTGSGDWSCPIKTITPRRSTVEIDIACLITSTTGFSASANTLLGQFNLKAERTPSVNPLVLTFDPAATQITRKSDGRDILATPNISASYQIETESLTLTPTLPAATATPTPTVGYPTATPAVMITPLATATGVITATPIIPAVTPTPIPCFCPAEAPPKLLGNANCDRVVDGVDFEIWREEFNGLRSTTFADFNCNGGGTGIAGRPNLEDLEIWKRGRWITALVERFAQEEGVSLNQVALNLFEQRTFNDTCLGCPQ